MSASQTNLRSGNQGLALYAKCVVGAVFVLIFIGGLVTSWYAGMAVPDWPLSKGSLNPTGWWQDFPVRLEHGHRLFAMLVGVLTGVLTAWVWGRWRALLVAAVISGVVPELARAFGAPALTVMHLRIWPAAIGFLAALFWPGRGRTPAQGSAVRWLAVAAFVFVCIQATLGGLRVVWETAGDFDAAQVLRIVHGSFAHAFLVSLVVIAGLLSGRLAGRAGGQPLGRLAGFAWAVTALIYLQLIVGATMRHLNAGLAIATFPHVTPSGGWMPQDHNVYVDLNFTHTRVGALVVAVLVVALIALVLRRARGESLLKRPALLLGALLLLQIKLGMLVIWTQKRSPALTTFHVVTGALMLATAALLAVRAQRLGAPEPQPAGGQS